MGSKKEKKEKKKKSKKTKADKEGDSTKESANEGSENQVEPSEEEPKQLEESQKVIDTDGSKGRLKKELRHVSDTYIDFPNVYIYMASLTLAII